MLRIRNRTRNLKMLTVEEAVKETSLPREALMASQAFLYNSIR